MRGRILYLMGDVESAVKHLQQAVRSDPDNTKIRSAYRKVRDIEERKEAGTQAFKQGLMPEAIDAWSTCIGLASDNDVYVSKVYLNRATALSKIKKYDEAIRDCNKAISIDAEYAKAIMRRGDCFSALGGAENLQKAIADYERLGEIQTDEYSSSDIKSKIRQAKVSLKRAGRKDLYGILGVAQDADDDAIRKAYRKAALKCHPDKQANKSEEEKAAAEALFKSTSEAYEILSDSEKRSRYDQGVEVEDLENPHASAHGHGGHGGIDPNILFQMFMQQQHGHGRGF
jgi:DnaJ homolog subfamily C member 7